MIAVFQWCQSPFRALQHSLKRGGGGHSLATEPKACARMQVGAALSMVYTSGAPIMFVGCGQTYVDLKRLNVKSVVRSLLK